MSTLLSKGVHILVFPFPAQGHMLPLLDSTHQLLLRGITITILVTPKNLPILDPLLSAHSSSSLQTLVLPFPDHPLVPSGVENVKDLGNSGNVLIISALAMLSENIIQWIKAHPSPPAAMLFDSFLGWTHCLGLPRICFHSTAAIMASVFDALWTNLDMLFALDNVDFLDLPRSPSLVREHLPSLFRRYLQLIHMSMLGKSIHLLVFPYPAQGHMLPLLDLTHQLLLRGLTITVLVTPKNLPILDPLLSIHPSSLQTLILPFPHHPLIPSGVENVKDLGNPGNVLIISALAKLKEQIIQWIKSHPYPPVAILSDSFLGWTHHLGIPRICFHCTTSFMSSVFDALWPNVDTIFSLDAVNFPDLPCAPSLVREHLPSLFRRYIKSDPNWELVKESMVANSSSWGYVNNTFDALEIEFLEFSRKKLGHNHVFAVGPLSLLGGSDSTSRGSTSSSSVSHASIWTWLGGCADGSVLYVCFGSQVLLKSAQVEALANGLELSGVKFIWVMKPATAQQVAEGYGSIPDGFEDRVKGRGLIIQGWAPQVPILSHRAVGGFVSHCGWNSLLEGIVGGVMILGWPMEADQFVNAKLLVDYKGVAIRLCEGKETVPDPIELGQKVAESMSGEIAEKVRAKELRSKAMEAVGSEGSSSGDLDRLVRELAQLQSV